MLPIKKSPQALNDLAQIALHIGQDNPDAALRFLSAAEETFDLIGRFPMIGSRVESASEEVAEFRVRIIVRFRNYLVYYRPNEDFARSRCIAQKRWSAAW